MAKDAELDRLKAAQDLAFQRKQTAHQAQQHAWDAKTTAREALNRAHEAKQRAYTEQDETWQDCQRVRSSNGPRIEQLNTQQERAFENMKNAFDSASSAHDRRDGASASSYASQGHAYKAESQGYVAERRQLVEGIRTARAKHEASKPAFQRAKEDFNSAKNTFDAAKANHDRAQVEFKRAKAEFDQAAKSFKTRLDLVKAQNARKASDKRSIAERAGVPYQYLDKVYVSKDTNGSTNIYFGGMGDPNGPGHGHYVMDRNGNITYRREPYEEHGGKNFTESQRDYTDLIGKEVASGGEFGFLCRFRGYNAHVESNMNTQGRAKIDIYYGPNGPFGPGHHHAIAYRESPYDFFYDEYR
jgi:hypothetical protein